MFYFQVSYVTLMYTNLIYMKTKKKEYNVVKLHLQGKIITLIIENVIKLFVLNFFFGYQKIKSFII